MTGPRLAVALGCGDGTDSLALPQTGWQVPTVDEQPAAIELLPSVVPKELWSQLQVLVADFTEMEVPTADLISCGWSLPHCPADRFVDLW